MEEKTNLTAKEQYDKERQEKEKMRDRKDQSKKTKKRAKLILWIGIPIILLGVLFRYISTQPSIPDSEFASSSSIHWHPELAVYIMGEKQQIPTNIGIGVAGHNPIHTHDTSGVLHVEFGGRTLKEDIKLKQFFDVWGKEFNSECIFDFCNGPDGQVKMLVNGEENPEFGEYIMQNSNKIEIRYE